MLHLTLPQKHLLEITLMGSQLESKKVALTKKKKLLLGRSHFLLQFRSALLPRGNTVLLIGFLVLHAFAKVLFDVFYLLLK